MKLITGMWAGLAVAALHCLVVLGIAGKYAVDRARLPTAWVRAEAVDPNLPVRGRYVALRLIFDCSAELGTSVNLSVRDGSLIGTKLTGRPTSGVTVYRTRDRDCAITPPIPYFIPEYMRDPGHLSPGKHLWVLVSVPPEGPPRPIRLEER